MSGGLWFFFWNTASWAPGPGPSSTTVKPSIFIVDPRFTTWDRWTAQMLQSHLQLGPSGAMKEVPESQWRSWADLFVSLPNNAGLGLPRSQFFKDWRHWAFAVNGILWVTG
jgi:hypothetical protein